MSRALADRLAALALLSVCVSYGRAAQDIQLLFGAEFSPFNARTFPTALAWAGGAVALLIAVRPQAGEAPPVTRAGLRAAALLSLLVLAYALTIGRIGFFLASAAFLAAGCLILGERDARTLLGVPLGVSLGLWAILSLGLGVYIDDPFLRLLGLQR